MPRLFLPATKLMQRLQLLPKFALITLAFLAPLIIVSTLLFKELNHSVSIAEQERAGLQQLDQIQAVTDLVRQHRALQYMYLNRNHSAGTKTVALRDQINERMALLAGQEKIGSDEQWKELSASWEALQSKLATARAVESYKQHSALLQQLLHYGMIVADHSHLSLDSVATTRQLYEIAFQTIPEVRSSLSELTGRGAVIIDTGIFLPYEDIFLTSQLTQAKYNLKRIPDQIESLGPEIADQPAFADRAVLVKKGDGYLEVARLQVLNSLDQISGNDLYAAGTKMDADLSALSAAAVAKLDDLLVARVSKNTRYQWMVVGVVALAVLIAAYFLAGFYLSFKRDMSLLGETVNRAAAGDLSRRIESEARDEIGDAVNAFGSMTGGLVNLVSDVKYGADNIAVAAQEIAQGNADLSSRTQQQAASLEETNATIEELTNTVRQNADNAGMAHEQTVQATDVTMQCEQMVSQVVDRMQTVNGSAHQILGIINLIDEIAFQTNLLALNAAVEAARAGVHGRGFAVVAGEVRNLAHRSASAASEIKTLINTSVSQIEDGSKLAEQANGIMQRVVSSINDVSQIVNGIALASKDQRAGIEQVNRAIAEMDEITQRNAALVEQSAASAESMYDQTRSLLRSVGAFKLDEQSSGKNMEIALHDAEVISLHHEEKRVKGISYNVA